MNVLFPTDFSETSLKAFKFAALFAERFNLPITVMHVYASPIISTGHEDTGLEMVTEQLFIDMETTYKKELEDFISRLKAEYDPTIELNHVLRMGHPATMIAKEAEQLGSKYIVVSVKDSKAVTRFLFGSVVNDLISKTDIPIITLPEPNPFRKLDKIAIAIDLTNDDISLINNTLEIATQFKSQVLVVHVHDSNLDIEDAIFDDFRNKFRSYIDQGLLSFHLIESLNIETGIEHFISDNNVDMLVMLKQKDYWLDFFNPSHTKAMVFHGQIPLLIVKE